LHCVTLRGSRATPSRTVWHRQVPSIASFMRGSVAQIAHRCPHAAERRDLHVPADRAPRSGRGGVADLATTIAAIAARCRL